MQSSPLLPRVVSGLFLSFPVAVWASDSVCSIHKVKSNSMEPSLRHGDVVLIRKSDVVSNLVDVVLSYFQPFDFERNELSTKERIQRIEGPSSLLLSRPPIVVPGDVVVYNNPSKAYPNEPIITRVTAVGGQTVRVCVLWWNVRLQYL